MIANAKLLTFHDSNDLKLAVTGVEVVHSFLGGQKSNSSTTQQKRMHTKNHTPMQLQQVYTSFQHHNFLEFQIFTFIVLQGGHDFLNFKKSLKQHHMQPLYILLCTPPPQQKEQIHHFGGEDRQMQTGYSTQGLRSVREKN